MRTAYLFLVCIFYTSTALGWSLFSNKNPDPGNLKLYGINLFSPPPSNAKCDNSSFDMCRGFRVSWAGWDDSDDPKGSWTQYRSCEIPVKSEDKAYIYSVRVCVGDYSNKVSNVKITYKREGNSDSGSMIERTIGIVERLKKKFGGGESRTSKRIKMLGYVGLPGKVFHYQSGREFIEARPGTLMNQLGNHFLEVNLKSEDSINFLEYEREKNNKEYHKNMKPRERKKSKKYSF